MRSLVALRALLLNEALFFGSEGRDRGLFVAMAERDEKSKKEKSEKSEKSPTDKKTSESTKSEWEKAADEILAEVARSHGVQ